MTNIDKVRAYYENRLKKQAEQHQKELDTLAEAVGRLFDDDTVPRDSLAQAFGRVPNLDDFFHVDEQDDFYWELVELELVKPMTREDWLSIEGDRAYDEAKGN